MDLRVSGSLLPFSYHNYLQDVNCWSEKSSDCKILPVAPFSQYSRQINTTTAEKESRGQDILHFLSFSLRFDQSSNQLVDSLFKSCQGSLGCCECDDTRAVMSPNIDLSVEEN